MPPIGKRKIRIYFRAEASGAKTADSVSTVTENVIKGKTSAFLQALFDSSRGMKSRHVGSLVSVILFLITVTPRSATGLQFLLCFHER